MLLYMYPILMNSALSLEHTLSRPHNLQSASPACYTNEGQEGSKNLVAGRWSTIRRWEIDSEMDSSRENRALITGRTSTRSGDQCMGGQVQTVL